MFYLTATLDLTYKPEASLEEGSGAKIAPLPETLTVETLVSLAQIIGPRIPY